MQDRTTAKEEFLRDHGWADCTRQAIPGDASFRRYERLIRPSGSAIKPKSAMLMDAPPEHEDTRPYVAVAQYLRTRGLHAPEVLAQDLNQGFLLLEDFGDRLFNHHLRAQPEDATTLYRQALDTLIALHSESPPMELPFGAGATHGLPAYDSGLLFRELRLFPDWYLGTGDESASPALWDELQSIFTPLFAQVQDDSVLVLRDYHADNLMLLQNGGMGLLDFQDAVRGHPAYDLVSLLQDARRDVSLNLETDMIKHFTETKKLNHEEFLAAYNILGAQRNAKIIGIFSRLDKRDNKTGYREKIPHVWGLLERNLAHPALADASALFNRIAPRHTRQVRT